jgi:acetyl esterase/lipase
MLRTMTADPSVAEPSSSVRTLSVPGLDLPVHLRGARPRGAAAPLVLHLHGGAFVCGDALADACLAELLAASGGVVASLQYPLAPAHRFPQAVEAGYATLEWLHRQRARLAGAGAPLLVAGEESGGNLAAAIAMMARDRGGPPLAGQVLVAPMLDPCAATASLRQTLGEQTCCKWMDGWQQYLRGPMDAEHPYAVPGRAQRLAGLAPALVLTGRDDPMRDEALAYAGRLRAAGIDVTEGVLPPTTGWPDTLLGKPAAACPCAESVRQHLRAFLQRATPPPP